MRVNPLRSAVAVVGGVLLLNFMDATLERALVSAIAQSAAADQAAYLAVRNRPLVLTVTLVTHALASALAGYIIGRIATVYEVRHAIAAAVVLTAGYAATFFTDNAMLPPGWVRAAMIVVTPLALVGGAHIRAEARAIRDEQAGTDRIEKERRQGVPGDSEERRQGVPGDSEERRQGVPGDSEERRQGVPANAERP